MARGAFVKAWCPVPTTSFEQGAADAVEEGAEFLLFNGRAWDVPEEGDGVDPLSDLIGRFHESQKESYEKR